MIKVYLKGIIGNVCIGRKAVNKSARSRSESIVVKNPNYQFNFDVLNSFCEEAQLLRVKKEAKTFLRFYRKKLLKGPRKIHKIFAIDHFTKVIAMYNNVTSEAQYIKKLPTRVWFFVRDPCFLLLMYSAILKDKAFLQANGSVKNITFGEIFKITQKLWSGKEHPFLWDLIVQKALQIFVFSVVDCSFPLSSTYGFKSNASCHSALESISRVGNRTTWFIQLDLVRILKRVNYKLSVSKINIEIKDSEFIHFPDKLLKSCFIDISRFDQKKFEKNKNVLSNYIFSSLFTGIFLHRFDVWVEKWLIRNFKVFRSIEKNFEYDDKINYYVVNKWQKTLSNLKRVASSVAPTKICKAFHEIYKQQSIQNSIKYYVKKQNHKKLWYLRHVDDILFGLTSSKSDVLDTCEKIKIVLDKELKTVIYPKDFSIHHHSGGVLFLGYHLFGKYNQKYQFSNKHFRLSNRVKFTIPINILIEKYIKKGFLRKSNKGKKLKYVARRINKYIFGLSDSRVVSVFNSILKDLANYYKWAIFPSVLNELYILLRRSCALTLAHKHKMVTTRSAFLMWGKDLTIDYKLFNKKKEIVNKSVFFDIPNLMLRRWKLKNLTPFFNKTSARFFCSQLVIFNKTSNVFILRKKLGLFRVNKLFTSS
jgi:hypothetical protein